MLNFIEHILDPRFWMDDVKATSDEEGIIARSSLSIFMSG